MQITEKDLEDLIFSAISEGPYILFERGFTTSLIINECEDNKVRWYRQVELSSYGRADLIGVQRFKGALKVNIIELKNVPVVSKDFNQVLRYKRAIQEILRNTLKGEFYNRIDCYLVGPSLEDGHFIQNYSSVDFIEFSYSINGISFKMTSKGAWMRGDGKLSLDQVSSSQRCVSNPIKFIRYGKEIH